MVVNQDSELIAEAKIDKNDEGGTTCFTGAFSATYGRGSDVLTLLLTATAATKRGHAMPQEMPIPKPPSSAIEVSNKSMGLVL